MPCEGRAEKERALGSRAKCEPVGHACQNYRTTCVQSDCAKKTRRYVSVDTSAFCFDGLLCGKAKEIGWFTATGLAVISGRNFARNCAILEVFDWAEV